MNRRQMISLLAASASAAVPFSALAAVAPPTLDDISRALNAMSTLEAAFTQFNADGSIATGTLYMSMPGKMRMEYDQGSNGGLFMVSAGRVAIFDSRSDSIATRVSLDSTPLAPFLARNVNLRHTREVFDTQADADLLSVYARDPDNPQRGWARFTFGGQPLRIISWVLVNEAGEETRVVLSPRQKTGHDISPRLFSIGAETNERAPRRFR